MVRPTPEAPLEIAGQAIHNRLFIGTGRFRSSGDLDATVEATDATIIAAAIRRVAIDEPTTAETLANDPTVGVVAERVREGKSRIVPNTSGARDAEQAVRIARLAREIVGHGWVKLEVTPNLETLLPDAHETLAAAEVLAKEGFVVLPYMQADPTLAKRLEDVGVAAVMPLGAPIGTGQGLRTRSFLELIIRDANVPVVVDAGLGLPSHACDAMELGADAVLANTALARAAAPSEMGRAFAEAVRAGRRGYLAGAMTRSGDARASSPLDDRLGS